MLAVTVWLMPYFWSGLRYFWGGLRYFWGGLRWWGW